MRDLGMNVEFEDLQSELSLIESLPEYLFRLVRKTFQQQLPTASNLKRWNRIGDPSCTLCQKSIPQTNTSYWTARHPWIATRTVITKLFSSLHNEFEHTKEPTNVFLSIFRPINSIRSTSLSSHVFDLTSFCAKNLKSWCWYSPFATKRTSRNQNSSNSAKYEKIGNCLQRESTHVPVSLFTVEVSVLGFVSDLKTFTKAAELPDLTTTIRSALTMKAITSSYDIYKRRNCPSISELNPTPEEC